MKISKQYHDNFDSRQKIVVFHVIYNREKRNTHQGYNYSSGEHVTLNSLQESCCSHPMSLRQTGRGNSSRDREPGKDRQKGDLDQIQDTAEMQSQYQKDFPPPSSCRRRRTPALPQPDNIGINPAFR